MIFGKFVTVIKAFFNSIANALWERDPIAIMRLEYDRSVEQLKEGRKGLELYRGLVAAVGGDQLAARRRAAVSYLPYVTKNRLEIQFQRPHHPGRMPPDGSILRY
jgi:hypothetical protein